MGVSIMEKGIIETARRVVATTVLILGSSGVAAAVAEHAGAWDSTAKVTELCVPNTSTGKAVAEIYFTNAESNLDITVTAILEGNDTPLAVFTVAAGDSTKEK